MKVDPHRGRRRVVVDTNVWISAALSREGAPAQWARRALAECTPVFSEATFAELETRKPAGVSAEEAARHEALLVQATTMNERHASMNAIESAPEAAALQTASLLPAPLANPIAAAALASAQKKGVVATDRYLTEARQVTAGAGDIVEQTLGQDPRLARLSQLAAKKQCTGPGR